jgi:DNA-binding response OmpR family regulator
MKGKILLVQDEEGLPMVLRDHLRSEGYFVICADDGKTGFQKATSQPFDLMILDSVMPGRRGLDLCRDIRRTGLRTPILILTACRATEHLIAGFKAGADACVAKPLDVMELSARIEALLRRVSAIGSNAYHAAPPSPLSTPWSIRAESGQGTRRDIHFPLNVASARRPLDDLGAQPATARKLPAPISEIVPGFQLMPDTEGRTPRTDAKAYLCSIAEDLVEFLESILAGARSRGRRGTKEI